MSGKLDYTDIEAVTAYGPHLASIFYSLSGSDCFFF